MCCKYNRRVGLVLVCPITTKVKGYLFEVAIPEGLEISVATKNSYSLSNGKDTE
jgi:mRNA-degrading endonuclease toxin of MazEF toxin-antitoxin module